MLKKVVSSNVCDENVAASQSVEQITEVHCLARQFLERSKSGRALAKKKRVPIQNGVRLPNPPWGETCHGLHRTRPVNAPVYF